MIAKSWSIDGIGKYLLQDLFLISVLAAFSTLKFRKFILYGLILALAPVAILDATSNFLQLTIGTDFFGNKPDAYRSDGVRLVGMFGHSFISLGLYLSAFMLFRATGFGRLISYAPFFLIVIVGSLRGYIFPLILLAYHFLFRMRWTFVFFASLAISVAVVIATFYVVSSGLQSESSGNAFRIIAWQNALEQIAHQPLFGINVPPPPLPEDFAVTEENLKYYQIYESMLLQDAVRYGLPLVLMKIVFFYYVGKNYYQRCIFRTDSLVEIKNFVVAFLITDYLIFSYFNMPIVALVAGIILGTKISENH